MKKQLEQVAIFQRAFGQNVASKPTLISDNKSCLRYELGLEELEEYKQACLDGDLVEVADSLTDQLYILCGTILEHGMQDIIEKCFDEIQNSNMSKLDNDGFPIINGENGVWDESRPRGKILKSYRYFSPRLAQFLEDEKQ